MKKGNKKVELLEIYDVEGYQRPSDGGSSSSSSKDKSSSGSKSGSSTGNKASGSSRSGNSNGNRGVGGNSTTRSNHSSSSNHSSNSKLTSSSSNHGDSSNKKNSVINTVAKTTLSTIGSLVGGAVGLGSKLISTTMGETKGNKTVKREVSTKKGEISPTQKIYNGNDYKGKIVTSTLANVLDSKLSDSLKGTLKTEDTGNTKKRNVLDGGGVYRTSQVTNKIGSEEKGVEQNIGYSSKLVSVNEEFNTGKDMSSPAGEILGTAEEKNITNGYENAVARLDNDVVLKIALSAQKKGTSPRIEKNEVNINEVIQNALNLDTYINSTMKNTKTDKKDVKVGDFRQAEEKQDKKNATIKNAKTSQVIYTTSSGQKVTTQDVGYSDDAKKVLESVQEAVETPLNATANFIKENIVGGTPGFVSKITNLITKGTFSTDGNETTVGPLTVNKEENSAKLGKGIDAKMVDAEAYIKTQNVDGKVKTGVGAEVGKSFGDIEAKMGVEAGASFDGNDLTKDGSFKIGTFIKGIFGEKEGEKSKEKKIQIKAAQDMNDTYKRINEETGIEVYDNVE